MVCIQRRLFKHPLDRPGSDNDIRLRGHQVLGRLSRLSMSAQHYLGCRFIPIQIVADCLPGASPKKQQYK